MPDNAALKEFIDKHIAEVEPLNTQEALVAWEFEQTGNPDAQERLNQLATQVSAIYTRADEYELLKSIPNEGVEDELIQRQHKVLLKGYQGRQMDPKVLEEMIRKSTAISAQFNTYRAELKGEKVTDNQIDEILRNSDDSQYRKEAWEASKQVGAEVAQPVLELVRMKNAEAKRLGFDNYYHMALELQEVPRDWLFELLGDLKRKSDPIFKEFKQKLDARLAERFNVSIEELRPWHYGDRFFQAPPKGEVDLDPLFADKNLETLTEQFFEKIGLPIGPLLKTADLYEREGKVQHAFCMHVDQKGDVRVLCNIKPTERWMGTMLHEYGHAVYEYYTDFDLPYLLRGAAHTLTTEAIAILMGGLVHNAAWLETYAGVSSEDAAKVAAAANEEDIAQKLIFLRWVLVVCHFERAMHENPDQDLNTLWWDLVEQFQFLKRPENRNAPDWASKIHIALSPAYYQNYELGEMMAAQLRHVLRTQVLNGQDDKALVTSPKVGEYLTEKLFKLGARFDWRKTVVESTGEPLNPDYLMRELGA